MSKDTFWLYDPSSLLSSGVIIPSNEMGLSERLNALTRLIILVTIILWFVGLGKWWLFLILGLILVIILYYTDRYLISKDKVREHYICGHPIRKRSILDVTPRLNPVGFNPY